MKQDVRRQDERPVGDMGYLGLTSYVMQSCIIVK
jgi:hypothetical protein